jgi:hypothetical protein
VKHVRPIVLLYSLLGIVPLLVGGAGLASYLLLRAGYSFLVWGLLPFGALLLLASGLGAVLGTAAGGNLPGPRRKEEKPHGEAPRGRPRRVDDV